MLLERGSSTAFKVFANILPYPKIHCNKKVAGAHAPATFVLLCVSEQGGRTAPLFGLFDVLRPEICGVFPAVRVKLRYHRDRAYRAADTALFTADAAL